MRRYWGDGSKFVCGVEFLADRKDCLVYSIGSSEHDGFERGILAAAPHCEVHTFDPTSSADAMRARSTAAGYRFHLVGLGSRARSSTGGTLGAGPLRTLQEIMADLGHAGRTLDILKIDCEGCEWFTLREQVFAPMRSGALAVGQLQVELHLLRGQLRPLPAIAKLFEDADAAGLRVFHKERNAWCGAWKVCLEYSLVSAEWARHVFHRTHCPDSVATPAELGDVRAQLDCD
ncbi:methyltransferase domain-containing protein [Tribonema minus]|uniref:Methyltransferase domain-containing protein n=1 Tax=Tribonema minus TaxID=303371 RepID=A0A835YJQ6_9STRA|nr:methyltransferase domain-containing protein [Tribonema minus]